MPGRRPKDFVGLVFMALERRHYQALWPRAFFLAAVPQAVEIKPGQNTARCRDLVDDADEMFGWVHARNVDRPKGRKPGTPAECLDPKTHDLAVRRFLKVECGGAGLARQERGQ